MRLEIVLHFLSLIVTRMHKERQFGVRIEPVSAPAAPRHVLLGACGNIMLDRLCGPRELRTRLGPEVMKRAPAAIAAFQGIEQHAKPADTRADTSLGNGVP